MSWFTVALFYLFCWWLVLFCVLPFGIRHEKNPEAGHSRGAPVKAHLKGKVIITTLLTAALTILFFWLTDGMLIRPQNG